MLFIILFLFRFSHQQLDFLSLFFRLLPLSFLLPLLFFYHGKLLSFLFFFDSLLFPFISNNFLTLFFQVFILLALAVLVHMVSLFLFFLILYFFLSFLTFFFFFFFRSLIGISFFLIACESGTRLTGGRFVSSAHEELRTTLVPKIESLRVSCCGNSFGAVP